ncbi:flagellar biosynthesis anti-sigma factor FlgM [Desulfonatronovibrio hydrogenovorans]|uniref:flagellar biosynthesis anti-sigma factor FlgM n=1 Tax=Desulfonatronovibrio hydrogenovorans TaxID=53245 RepID=UPI0004909BF4|nr:flagellar biosynthesis anti-sigma factor FlgM [Desulfonatronovibrio hydrogenovorans]
MQIKGLLTGLQTYEQSKIDKNKTGKGSDGSRTGSSSDKVTLSEGAKLYRSGLEQALTADEVRSEKIEELKAQIKDGTYQPDSRRIAEKMIREDMEGWFSRS